MKPLLSQPHAESGWLRRGFNRFCDWLRSVAMGIHECETASLRAELDEGYVEIAEHAAKMRQKYPDAYAEAEKELRRRYIHLDE